MSHVWECFCQIIRSLVIKHGLLLCVILSVLISVMLPGMTSHKWATYNYTTNKVEYDISKLFLNEKMIEILIYDFSIFHEICLPAYN